VFFKKLVKEKIAEQKKFLLYRKGFTIHCESNSKTDISVGADGGSQFDCFMEELW
jgi:hypothetical protein